MPKYQYKVIHMKAPARQLPIAFGRTAEIYDWETGKILKLLYDWCPAEWVKSEVYSTQVVHATGLHIPAVIDQIEIDGRNGIIYERIEGSSMLQVMRSKLLKLDHFSRLLAELHVDMHTRTVPQLPSIKDHLENSIRHASGISGQIKETALATLDQLPDGEALCHNDYHPDNILMTEEGPVIIDWITATRGDPMADVARTSLLLQIGSPPQGISTPIRWLIAFIRARVHQVYMSQYFALHPGNQRRLQRWMFPVAVARLNEDITEERQQLIALIENLKIRI
jgi:hypothetical protein